MSFYANYGYIIANATGSNCPAGTKPGPKGPSGNRYCLDETEMYNATGVPQSGDEVPGYVDPYAANQDVQQQNVGTSAVAVGQGLLTGLLNVFAPKAQTQTAAPAPGVPTWVYVAVPLGLVGVFLMVKGRQPARAVAGYKRRKSRRSHR